MIRYCDILTLTLRNESHGKYYSFQKGICTKYRREILTRTVIKYLPCVRNLIIPRVERDYLIWE